MRTKLKALLASAIVITAVGCSNDPPPPSDTGIDDSATTGQDNVPDVHSALCRLPLENDGVLMDADGGDPAPGIRAWYYECSKNFPAPTCDDRYSPVLGVHYTLANIQSSTAYSDGGLRISYRCKGLDAPNPPMSCVDGLQGQLLSTTEFETTYECSLSLAAPWCHSDFRTISAYTTYTDYAWDGGWGPGNLSYQCVRLSSDMPTWPVE